MKKNITSAVLLSVAVIGCLALVATASSGSWDVTAVAVPCLLAVSSSVLLFRRALAKTCMPCGNDSAGGMQEKTVTDVVETMREADRKVLRA